MNNIPLQSWWLPIQPNSAIAILTTIGKAALTVPAAACISQLKWRHFLLQPRTLADLQLFDEASRGPWGSALLFCRLCSSPQVFVALGFAFVTIVALGIDAVAQQVLSFSLKETPLVNTTIEVGVANSYFSKGFIEEPFHNSVWLPNVDLLSVQAAIVTGASGSLPNLYFNCPEPATEFTPSCRTNTTSTGMNCTYTTPSPPDGGGLPMTMEMHWDPENNSVGRAMLFQSAYNDTRDPETMPASLGTFVAIKTFTDGYTIYTDDGQEEPPATDIGLGTLYWCVQTFHNVTASPRGIDAGSMTSERIGTQGLTVATERNRRDLHISRMAVESLPLYLKYVFTFTIYHDIYRPAKEYGETLRLGYTYYMGDTAAAFHNVGTTISNLMRSDLLGDNYNATAVQGTASFAETYIHCQGRSGDLAKDEKTKAPFAVDGHVITRGTQVGVKNLSVDHNENYFPEPFAFCRERWLVDDSEGSQKAKRVRGLFGRGAWGCRQGHGLSGVQYSGCEDAMVL
ncbi:hypothetical protein SUNI508_04588 [Seiridium unicorne]|uniref:Uncharacterized protein n=1 Tax=Seiridium unicorne TaxID=138068 RepID=A0ABR2V8S7_9PEZI